MHQQMRYEAEYFDEKKRLLRVIFNETLAQCNDAVHKKTVNKEKYQEISLKAEDERYIRNMLDNPISIILMGNRPCVKARIVNYMLGYELLPVFDIYDPDYKHSRRAVRIQYGTQRRHAFCIRHFELLECSPLHTERVVSFEDLRLESVAVSGDDSDVVPLSPAAAAAAGGLVTSAGGGIGHGASFAAMVQQQQQEQQELQTGAINSGSGCGSNTSSGLDSAVGDQSSNTPTTLSLNSSCSLIKSVSQLAAGQNRPQSETAGGTAAGKNPVAPVSSHIHHHRHGHSSGYSSQQNVAAATAAAVAAAGGDTKKTTAQPLPSAARFNFAPYDEKDDQNDDHEDDDDDDDDEEILGETDYVNEMTTMEIVLPHELLEKNLQIRVAPDVESFDLIYRTTFSRTNPIIIYCFERYDDELTETDRRHLRLLQQRLPSTPVFFAHIIDFDVGYHSNNPHHHHHHFSTPFLTPHHYPYGSNTYRLSSDPSPTRTTTPVKQSSAAAGKATESPPPPLESFSNAERKVCSAESSLKSDLQQPTSSHKNGGGDGGAKEPITGDGGLSPLPASSLSRRNTLSMGDYRGSALRRSASSGSSAPAVVAAPTVAKKMSATSASTYLQASESLWRQLKDLGFFQEMPSTLALRAPMDRREKYQSNGYYIINDRPFKCAKQNADNGMDVSSRFICHSYEFCYFVDFFRSMLKSNLVVASTLLNEIHNQFIQYYIFTAFDLTWSLNYCIPKRLEYARSKEAELYMSLMGIANRKQEEIRRLIDETLQFMRDDILDQAANYSFGKAALNCHGGAMVSATEVKQCAEEIKDFVFMTLNRAIAVKLISSVDIMRDSLIGTLERCLKQLEEYRQRRDFSPPPNNRPGKYHPAAEGGANKPNRMALQNQLMLPHSHHHHQQQQRAQEEKIDLALSRLLNLAYSIEINANSCSSMLRILWERMKDFFLMFSVAWKPTCRIDAEWKRKVAADLLDNLSEAKLARSICTQFRDKLKLAHETFLNSMANLENILMTRLKEIDHRRQQVRKNDAPMFARLALESTSFIDAILYGPPELGKEIGRGQYGVVFSTKKSWGHCSRVAVKSIMICDDKHWNDLAMEFYYTRSLPENERIVQIRGSIIEHNYNGASSYVYLIMDRLVRDLYAGLKAGLEWLQRLQIALDVVHGLRFLHNHGLIHRDIKLKNVLLDKHSRAKITDLGFCKSEVMISGSIVGTPIHMAPEVFTGKYDSMVDVYAFGILFWYICAGSVELPQIFEQCHNKDHLWIAVKKGLRPEKLPVFDDACFQLMERCWAGEPTKRPLLGDVEQCLMQIKLRYENSTTTNS